MMSISDPKNLVGDEEDILYGIKSRVAEILSDYDTTSKELAKLYLLMELVEADKDFDFTKINY